MNSSASRREQIPVSLMCMFRRIPAVDSADIGELAVTVGLVVIVRAKGYRTIASGSGAGWPVLPRPAHGEFQIQRETEEGADKNHQCQHTNRFNGEFHCHGMNNIGGDKKL